MGKVINLNKVRKQKARDAAEVQAAANRVRFGRTKAEKARDEAAVDESQHKLDLLKREPATGRDPEPEPRPESEPEPGSGE